MDPEGSLPCSLHGVNIQYSTIQATKYKYIRVLSYTGVPKICIHIIIQNINLVCIHLLGTPVPVCSMRFVLGIIYGYQDQL
jgi:hypothetical protein